MAKRFKAIAFDLDGTLVDSVPDLAAAVNDMLTDLGYSVSQEGQVRTWVGNGAEVLVQRALAFALEQAATAEETAKGLGLFLQHYQLHLNQHSHLYSGVKSSLERLYQQGYQLAIVTNKPAKFIAPLLSAFGIEHYFSLVLGGDTLEKKKPDPMPLFHIMSEWGLQPSELLMVGDSENDIFAAKSAGIASIGLTYGYNYGEDIGLCGPDAVFDDFSDIVDWVNA